MENEQAGTQALAALEFFQRLMSEGYILRMQKVDGHIFVFANYTGIGDKAQLAAHERNLVECARVMEIEQKQGKEK